MEHVRLGVIGIGNMGSEHCRSIIAGHAEPLELVAVADRRADRRAWARDTLPASVRVFPEGDALIDSGLCDAVLIATPHYQHPTLGMHAFERGLHVLSEKPISVSTLDARRLIDAARASGKTFALMFNQRTNCVYRRLREMIRSGELGAVKRVNWTITDWYRTQRYYDSGSWRATWDGEGGGVLLNQCPHQLDLLQWLFGLPTRVRAFCHEGKWHRVEVEDDVTAYMEFPGGATGVFITSTGDLPGANRLEVTLERGRVLCDGASLVCYRIPMNEREYCFTLQEAYSDLVPERIEIATDGENPQHAGVLRAFGRHILTGAPLVAEGAEGLHSLLLINAMYLSAWLDKTVDLPFDEELYARMLARRRACSHIKRVEDVTFNTDHSFGGRIVAAEKPKSTGGTICSTRME